MDAYQSDVVGSLHVLGLIGSALLPLGAVIVGLLVAVAIFVFWSGVS